MEKVRYSRKSFLCALLLAAQILPQVLFFAPERVEAQGLSVPVNDLQATNFLRAIAAAAKIQAEADAKLVVKEFTLDAILYALVKGIIQQLTGSIVKWINSGFEGGPAFVTNPGEFFLDTADIAIGNFIEGTDLDFLCNPIRDLNFKLNLGLRYGASFRHRIGCTLTGILNNAKNVGDFSKGGWEGWLSLTTQPQNNIYGAQVMTDIELDSRVARAFDLQKSKLDWGKGFLSWEKCTAYVDDDNNPATDDVCSRFDIQTPGTVIENQLGQTLGTGIRQLEIADEINEIVGALFSQLLTQVFSSAGLAGTNTRSSSPRRFIDSQTTALFINPGTEPGQTILNRVSRLIGNALNGITYYRNLKQGSYDITNKAQSLLQFLVNCYESKGNLFNAERGVALANIDRLTIIKSDLFDDISAAVNDIRELDQMKKLIQDGKMPAGSATVIQNRIAALESKYTAAIITAAKAENTNLNDPAKPVSVSMAALIKQTLADIERCDPTNVNNPELQKIIADINDIINTPINIPPPPGGPGGGGIATSSTQVGINLFGAQILGTISGVNVSGITFKSGNAGLRLGSNFSKPITLGVSGGGGQNADVRVAGGRSHFCNPANCGPTITWVDFGSLNGGVGVDVIGAYVTTFNRSDGIITGDPILGKTEGVNAQNVDVGGTTIAIPLGIPGGQFGTPNIVNANISGATIIGNITPQNLVGGQIDSGTVTAAHLTKNTTYGASGNGTLTFNAGSTRNATLSTAFLWGGRISNPSNGTTDLDNSFDGYVWANWRSGLDLVSNISTKSSSDIFNGGYILSGETNGEGDITSSGQIKGIITCQSSCPAVP